MSSRMIHSVAVAALLACTARALEIETVHVGNPGNSGELSGEGAGGFGPDAVVGAVGYEYRIGKFEVTAGQYTAFLNAVAATDTYGLYNSEMDRDLYPQWHGCNIKRTGIPGGYRYNVAPDWANRPATSIGWGDAARFCNWLHNGQPTGTQGLDTTEDGAYLLNGATTDKELISITRRENAKWFIPTEDEWYKAAYHKNDGATGNYWDYATGTDTVPENDLLSPDPGNNASFNDTGYLDGYTIGAPYFVPEVGVFENSGSPYGTFDQAGGAWEWTENAIGSGWGLRGGSWYDMAYRMHAAGRTVNPTAREGTLGGLRVATLVDSFSFPPGDLDEDGVVGVDDLAVVRANWGQYLAGSENGDPSGDGFVDSDDLNIVRANWSTLSAAAVPEPGLAVLMFAGFWLLRRRTG